MVWLWSVCTNQIELSLQSNRPLSSACWIDNFDRFSSEKILLQETSWTFEKTLVQDLNLSQTIQSLFNNVTAICLHNSYFNLYSSGFVESSDPWRPWPSVFLSFRPRFCSTDWQLVSSNHQMSLLEMKHPADDERVCDWSFIFMTKIQNNTNHQSPGAAAVTSSQQQPIRYVLWAADELIHSHGCWISAPPT